MTGAIFLFLRKDARGASMATFGRQTTGSEGSAGKRDVLLSPSRCNFWIMLLVMFFAVGLSACGETAKPVTSPAADQVDSYFGGPFVVAGSALHETSSSFDHTAGQIAVSGFITNQTNQQVPTDLVSGAFLPAPTGFLSVTENFAPNSSGVMSAQNPPLTGAWAIEIPGAGALANFLSIGSTGTRAAPAAMAENKACPDFLNPTAFLYVTVPRDGQNSDSADYGGTTLTSQGSAITFRTQPFLVGMPPLTGFNVTGGCSITNLGALTAFPLNSFGTPGNLELISLGRAGLLVSSYNAGSASSPGAFGGGTGVIGVAQPTGPVDVSAVLSAHYNGFLYAPQNNVPQPYDITTLAAAFGNHTAGSQPCSALQASLATNNGQGAGTVPVLPSANSLYGGEFLTASGSGSVNDPTGANSSENCDVVIDLGEQDSAAGGVFPKATVFIGSNYPPYSSANPWACSDTGSICAVSFPAAAVVGKVQGQYVIFVRASASSTPPAQLPDNFGNRVAQPLGIYLF